MEPTGSGLDDHLGVEIETAEPERVVLTLTVSGIHLQPAGLVHGGLYSTLAETSASVGASLNATSRGLGRGAVGLDNHTTFLRAVGEGTLLRAEAVPRHAGRHTQAWTVTITDAGNGRELALSIVRLYVVGEAEQVGPQR